MKAFIFDIQRASTVDGPGIRTTVFFKGCNLRCQWCHNPESWERRPQMLFYENKCSGCGKCVKVCPTGTKDCTLCGKCTIYCPTDARTICGKEYTVEEVYDQIVKDKAYYDNSGGGVTFSGGECMLQVDFLAKLLRKCRENGIHTAVDTAGNVPWESFEKVLPDTDLFLYDMKCLSEEKHKEVTGVSNQLLLQNLAKLAECAKVVIRIPLIPTVNDDPLELKDMKTWLRNHHLTETEILPYHKMGEHKYKALGLVCREFSVPDPDKVTLCKELFQE